MHDSKYLSTYLGLLKIVGCVVSADGYVKFSLNANSTTNLRQNNHDVVVPTGQHLNYPRDTDVVFELMPEPVLGEVTPMLKGYSRLMANRLNITYATLCHSLLMVLVSKINRKTLSQGQLAFVDLMTGTDGRTLGDFTQILRHMTPDMPNRAFVKLDFKRHAPVNNTRYARVTRTSFPLYEELRKEGDVFGIVKLRKKDRELFIKLLEFILPGQTALDAYDAGSNNPVAPQLDSLMWCAQGFALQFNQTLQAFFAGNPEAKDMHLDINWQSPVA